MPVWHRLTKDIPKNKGWTFAIGLRPWVNLHEEGTHDRSDRDSSTIEGTGVAIDPWVR